MKNLLTFALFFIFAASAFGQEYRLVGKIPAPTMKLVALDGKTYNTDDLKGKVVVYNLWYVGCPPCMEEIPKLNEIVAEYQGKDVVFIGLATNNKAELEGFLKKNPFKYQIVPNAAQNILVGFGEPDKGGNLRVGFPMHIVVNKNGYVELKMQGIKGIEAVRTELANQFKNGKTE